MGFQEGGCQLMMPLRLSQRLAPSLDLCHGQPELNEGSRIASSHNCTTNIGQNRYGSLKRLEAPRDE
jgi:hypothetical protein